VKTESYIVQTNNTEIQAAIALVKTDHIPKHFTYVQCTIQSVDWLWFSFVISQIFFSV